MMHRTWFLFAWKESLTDIVLSLEKRKRVLASILCPSVHVQKGES